MVFCKNMRQISGFFQTQENDGQGMKGKIGEKQRVGGGVGQKAFELDLK